jgi:hypothetical protein
MAAFTEDSTQPPPSAGGKNVRLVDLTRGDGTIVVEQVVGIGDPNSTSGVAQVTAEGLLAVMVKQQDEVLVELRRTNRILEIAFGQEVSVDDVA